MANGPRNAAYLEEDAEVVSLLAQLQQRHRPLVRHVLRLVHAVGAVYKYKIEEARSVTTKGEKRIPITKLTIMPVFVFGFCFVFCIFCKLRNAEGRRNLH